MGQQHRAACKDYFDLRNMYKRDWHCLVSPWKLSLTSTCQTINQFGIGRYKLAFNIQYWASLSRVCFECSPPVSQPCPWAISWHIQYLVLVNDVTPVRLLCSLQQLSLVPLIFVTLCLFWPPSTFVMDFYFPLQKFLTLFFFLNNWCSDKVTFETKENFFLLLHFSAIAKNRVFAQIYLFHFQTRLVLSYLRLQHHFFTNNSFSVFKLCWINYAIAWGS